MDEGISFIVRIRDEEEMLETSIRSLFRITVPHEILLILHVCTDSSKSIAERLASENPNIRVLEYNTPISRPGYETLCTNRNSPHSIMTYYTWCYNQSKYPWKCKWDADFVASPEFVDYVNSNGWCRDRTKSHELFINAASSDGTVNTERYLVSGNFHFSKYWFWELIELPHPKLTLYINAGITHQSVLSKKKTYWNASPWFLDNAYLKANPQHYEEAISVLNRYIKLIQICGIEPNAQARASNPESANVFWNVKQNIELLQTFGISPFE
jgi:hypothetical protein